MTNRAKDYFILKITELEMSQILTLTKKKNASKVVCKFSYKFSFLLYKYLTVELLDNLAKLD